MTFVNIGFALPTDYKGQHRITEFVMKVNKTATFDLASTPLNKRKAKLIRTCYAIVNDTAYSRETKIDVLLALDAGEPSFIKSDYLYIVDNNSILYSKLSDYEYVDFTSECTFILPLMLIDDEFSLVASFTMANEGPYNSYLRLLRNEQLCDILTQKVTVDYEHESYSVSSAKAENLQCLLNETEFIRRSNYRPLSKEIYFNTIPNITDEVENALETYSMFQGTEMTRFRVCYEPQYTKDGYLLNITAPSIIEQARNVSFVATHTCLDLDNIKHFSAAKDGCIEVQEAAYTFNWHGLDEFSFQRLIGFNAKSLVISTDSATQQLQLKLLKDFATRHLTDTPYTSLTVRSNFQVNSRPLAVSASSILNNKELLRSLLELQILSLSLFKKSLEQSEGWLQTTSYSCFAIHMLEDTAYNSLGYPKTSEELSRANKQLTINLHVSKNFRNSEMKAGLMLFHGTTVPDGFDIDADEFELDSITERAFNLIKTRILQKEQEQ